MTVSPTFFEAVIRTGDWYRDPSRHSDLALLEPNTRRKVQAILQDAKAHGVSVVCYETYRSQERQEQLYQQGATQLQHVGTHHYGVAADLVPLNSAGEPTWDGVEGAFQLIAHLCHVHLLISGADWGRPGVPHRFIDQPHCQYVTSGRRQSMLLAGLWYPPENGTYNPYADLAQGY